MTHRPLIDEAPTNQELQCQATGSEFFDDSTEYDDSEELSFGADPFDILAHRQEQGDLS